MSSGGTLPTRAGSPPVEAKNHISDLLAEAPPAPGELVAQCDGCDKVIYGVRFNCQACQDFDYCSECVKEASLIHPTHAFAARRSPGGAGAQDMVEQRGPLDLECASWAGTIHSSSPLLKNWRPPCRSCEPFSRPLATMHMAYRNPEIMKGVRLSLSWPMRISRLVEATQKGCQLCAMCLQRFFGRHNFFLYSYAPEIPWYAHLKPVESGCESPAEKEDGNEGAGQATGLDTKPKAVSAKGIEKERRELVNNAMRKMEMLKTDVFPSQVTLERSMPGMELPDFSNLRISISRKAIEMHGDTVQKIFPWAGQQYLDLPVFAIEGDPAAGHISARVPNATPGSAQTMAKIRAWMHECEQKHGAACSPDGHNDRLPLRVMDLSPADGDQHCEVRLCETNSSQGPKVGRYAALSYCWGGPQPFQTTKSTLADRKAGFSLGALPRGLQDAVRITRSLGLRYLWVDSVCIVQDDSADKAHSFGHMADIYRNSHVTISAARSDSVKESFLDDWADPTTGLWPSLITLPYALPAPAAKSMQEAVAMDPSAVGTLLLGTDEQKLAAANKDPVARRAWCLQERILSPRLLCFGRCPTWRCRRATWSDGSSGVGRGIAMTAESADERRLTGALLTMPAADAGAGPSSFPHADLFRTSQLHASWRALLSRYTESEISVGSDRFPAIGGVAAALARVTGDKYYAGLWGSDLLREAMWHAETREWQTRPPQGWRAPTWSWAAVECPVSHGLVTEDAAALASVLRCTVTPAPEHGPFGEVASRQDGGTGELEINGPFSEVARQDLLTLLNRQEMAPPPPSNDDVSDWYLEMMTHIQKQPRANSKQMEVDEGLPDHVFALITFSRDWMQRYEKREERTCWFGLLLKEAKGEDGRYERIGGFWGEDDEWMHQDSKPWGSKTVTLI